MTNTKIIQQKLFGTNMAKFHTCLTYGLIRLFMSFYDKLERFVANKKSSSSGCRPHLTPVRRAEGVRRDPSPRQPDLHPRHR